MENTNTHISPHYSAVNLFFFPVPPCGQFCLTFLQAVQHFGSMPLLLPPRPSATACICFRSLLLHFMARKESSNTPTQPPTSHPYFSQYFAARCVLLGVSICVCPARLTSIDSCLCWNAKLETAAQWMPFSPNIHQLDGCHRFPARAGIKRLK